MEQNDDEAMSAGACANFMRCGGRCTIQGYLAHNQQPGQVYDICKETALQDMSRLSERVGNTILAKREDTQPVLISWCMVPCLLS